MWKKPFKYNKSSFRDRKIQVKTTVTSSNLKTVAIVCFECAKGVTALGGVAELG
jgi:hypothetical protein